MIVWISLAIGLLIFQLISGTDLGYSFLVFAFFILTGLTVLALGGLTTLPGAGVTYLACQHVLISQIAKIFFWQPADSRLTEPITTMEMYIVGMAGFFCAALVARKIKFRRTLFEVPNDERRLFWLAVVVTTLSALRAVLVTKFGVNSSTGYAVEGGALGPLRVITFLDPLAVAASTAWILVRSNGRQSISPLGLIAMALPMLGGVLGAGRQGIATPPVMWLITCFAYGFRFRFVHVFSVIVGLYIVQFILFPYALVARATVRTGDVGKNISLATNLLCEVIAEPGKYSADDSEQDMDQDRRRYFYYGSPNATLDRYSLIDSADGIVGATLRDGTTGGTTFIPELSELLPRFLDPDKVGNIGNLLAHRAPGLVGKDDYTTGITLGFIVECFSDYGWYGAFAIPFALLLGSIISFSFMYRVDMRRNIIPVAFLLNWAWSFSEGSILTQLLTIVQGPIIVIVALFTLLFLVDQILKHVDRQPMRRVVLPTDMKQSQGTPN
jgi:hypothetical protein